MTSRSMSQCAACARYRSPLNPANKLDKPMCAAFPRGIPAALWNNRVDHREPVEDDRGLVWTPGKHGTPFPKYAFAKAR